MGKKVGESENLHCNNNDKKKIIKKMKHKNKKKICGQLNANPFCSPGYLDLKSTVLSTRPRSSMQIIHKKYLLYATSRK